MTKPVYAIYANNKDTDQPAHPRSLISVFVVRCLDSIIHIDTILNISREFSSPRKQNRPVYVLPGRTKLSKPKAGFLVTWLSYETWDCLSPSSSYQIF